LRINSMRWVLPPRFLRLMRSVAGILGMGGLLEYAVAGIFRISTSEGCRESRISPRDCRNLYSHSMIRRGAINVVSPKTSLAEDECAMGSVREQARRGASALRFSLGRLLLLPLVLAVCMAFIPGRDTPMEESIRYGPLWLLSPRSGDIHQLVTVVGVLVCIGTGMSVVSATLWPNRYTLSFVALMIGMWLFFGWSYASCRAL
jgi:hypothetical protein